MAGLGFASLGVRVLLQFMPGGSFPVTLNLSPDVRLLGFSFGVAVLTGALFGLVPALRATRLDLVAWLKNDASAASGVLARLGLYRLDLRKSLVVGQVALSLLLLVGAGLLVRSLRNLQKLDTGFQRENLLMVRVDPGQNGYKGQRLRNFYERLREEVQRLPGVRVSSLANITPLGGSRWNWNVAIQGYQWKPDERPHIDMNAVSPRYFETLEISILLGRDFRDQNSPAFTPDPPERPAPGPQPPDTTGPPRVAIISEAMAKRFFPNESAVGKRFSLNDTFAIEGSYEIVGVVRDSRYFNLRQPTESMIYLPNWGVGSSSRELCVRTSGNPARLIQAIRQRVQALDNSVPVLRARTMEQFLDEHLVQERLMATLCSFFGSLALLLAAVGLYGIMAHRVTRRTREIGIRMALGAQRSGVLWMVLREAILLVLAGTVVGVPAALALTRYVSTFLYGITPRDPATIVLTAGLLGLVTLVASYLPARRATTVDPMLALRYE